MILILQALIPLMGQVNKLIELAQRADSEKLNTTKIQKEIQNILAWEQQSSASDWDIVKKGKKRVAVQ